MICEKIKTINYKIEQNKGQYDLKRQAPKTSGLSSRKVSQYEFLTCKDVWLKKDFLEKSATIKRLEYSSLGLELKKKLTLQNNDIKD